MPAANAGRGGGGPGGGGSATGQRTVFRPPWVKDASEAAAPPPPTGPPWRRQSRAGPAAAEEASGGPSGNSTATMAPVKAPETTDKKVKVIPIMRQESGDGGKGADAPRNRTALKPVESSAPSARGRAVEAADKREKVVPIMRVDSKAQDTADKKAKVIPISRVESRDENPSARNKGNARGAEATEAPPQRGKLSRQEKQAEPAERKSSVAAAAALNRAEGPLENGLAAKDRQQQKQPSQRQQQRQESLQRQPSQQKVAAERGPPGPPPPPPPPPMAPPPPPMLPADIQKLEMTPQQRARLEALKSRPRRRPDWATMMKEVEQGKKLRHVECNDRSKPLLPSVKAKGQFVYETEQKNIHNQLLNQIQQGVKLKRVVTNDRSRPILEGLRKFRRQMTIEEQLQQAEEAVEPEPDELDDIDKVRDDLQSTKQMLALELQNKAQAERENRLLQARIFALEEQLAKERERARVAEEERDRLKEATDYGIPGMDDPLDSLRAQVALAGKTAYEYQQKYQDACKKLELAKANLEDEEHKNLMLEKRLQAAKDGKGGAGASVATSTTSVQTDPVVVVGSEVIPLTKQPSRKEIARAVAAAAAALPQNQQQQQNQKGGEDDDSEYTEESYSESDEEAEESESDEAKQERRHAREMKMLASKLKSYREKEGSAKKERKALKEQHERLTKTLRTERKKYRLLQKEVDKMAKLMKEEEEEEEEDGEEEEESEESSEEESSEEESSEEEPIPEDDPKAPPEKKTFRFEQMIKKHENALGALKKGNYAFKANIDRLKDDLEKQKEMYVNLQEDLNSVLAELG